MALLLHMIIISYGMSIAESARPKPNPTRPLADPLHYCKNYTRSYIEEMA